MNMNKSLYPKPICLLVIFISGLCYSQPNLKTKEDFFNVIELGKTPFSFLDSDTIFPSDDEVFNRMKYRLKGTNNISVDKEAALNCAKYCAYRGHGEALYLLAELEMKKLNSVEAIILLRKAHDAGFQPKSEKDKPINEMLATCNQDIDMKQLIKTEKEFLRKSESDYEKADGYYLLGRYYYYGIGFERNPELGLSYLKKAALHSSPSPKAAKLLVELYSNEKTAQSTLGEGFSLFYILKWLSICEVSERNYPIREASTIAMACAMEDGIFKYISYGIYEKLTRLINRDYQDFAIVMAAELLVNGNLGEVNYYDAMEYYKKLTSSYNYADFAREKIAFIEKQASYIKLKGLKRKYDELLSMDKVPDAPYLEVLKNLAVAGYSVACYRLANVYRDGGLGMQKDPTKAAEYFFKGAELGESISISRIGNYYYLGDGVEKNKETALFFFMAAEFFEVSGCNSYYFSEILSTGSESLAKDEEWEKIVLRKHRKARTIGCSDEIDLKMKRLGME